jgi:hypothetical protein
LKGGLIKWLPDLLCCGTNSWTVRKRERERERETALKENEGNGKLKTWSSILKKFILTFENGRLGIAVHAVAVCVAAMCDRRHNNT